MNKNIKIKPEIPGGFRDYLPDSEIKRKEIISKIEYIFKIFGFLPTSTPGIEKLNVLTGGDPNFNKQIFRVVSRAENKQDLALRFDLTVPLARLISANSDKLLFPFKRYQIGNVWRGERQQSGRYKEFMQCDVDIIGSDKINADAEIISVIYNSLKYIGLKNFLIKINNRKILDGLLNKIKYTKKDKFLLLRHLDKIDKIGSDSVIKNIKSDKSLNLNNKDIIAIKKFINISTTREVKNSNKNILTELKLFFNGINIAIEGINEISKLINLLSKLNIPKKNIFIDTSIVRGLGYYTGNIFETVLLNKDGSINNIGSIFSGGRYNNLVERFSSASVPAVGASLGLDRLFAFLEKENYKFLSEKYYKNVIILNFESASENKAYKLLNELRNKNICSEIYIGNDKSLKGQLFWSIKNGFNFVVIIGKDELENNSVTIKNIKNKKQFNVKYNKAVDFFTSKFN